MRQLTNSEWRYRAIIGCAALGILLARPANATEWIFCSDSRSAVDLGLLLGQDDAVSIAGATLKHGSANFTTNSVYGEGELFQLRVTAADKRSLRADLAAAGDGKALGEVHLKKVKRGSSSGYQGQVVLTGKGRWKVTCDGE